GNERPCRPLASFARAEHKHFATAEWAKNPLCKIDRDRSNRYRAARNFSVRSNLLSHPKSTLKQAMQPGPGRARLSRRFVRLFRLTENLALAHNHRIEPRRNAEKMLHAVFVLVAIKWRSILTAIIPDVSNETARNLIRRYTFFRCGINFDAIAGREQQRFHATCSAQDAICLGMAGKTLARFHVRGVMAQADAEKIHGGDCIC